MSIFHNISSKPIIIAGPCSVESQQQLRCVVETLASESRVSLIRCGVWKPRTHPGGFEGIGERALEWIEREREENPRQRFCCEVASAEHVEKCLRHGIDAVWIGARTSINPFLVSEIASALEGSDTAVMVKNPPTPDIELWLGAIERIEAAGVGEVAAIHRGFTTYADTGYRNNPLWEIPIELKRRRPTLPILCDPSHIGGRRDLVATISQTALDMHFDGLMIECHPDPDKALTDSRQQIAAAQLTALLDRLRPRHDEDATPVELVQLRKQLDTIDAEIVRLLSRRMKISHDIGAIKSSHNMPIFQPQRWQQVVERQIEAAHELGLSEQFVKEIMEKIHGESLRQQ